MAGLSPKTAEPQARLVATRVDPYRVLDLFSGIGGFSLGLERTGGFKTIAFCEIDRHCRRVLETNWPGVLVYGDVRYLGWHAIACMGPIDVVCGGFPCQDISAAGKRAGLAGEHSGLWRELARIIRLARPRYAIVENVAALLSDGMGDVLGDLAALGYDAEWHCIPAAFAGAPHLRDRVWIVAYPASERRGARRPRRSVASSEGKSEPIGSFQDTDAHGFTSIGAAIARQELRPWDDEPALDRVVDGLPYRMVEDDLRALGNAVVPQIAEIIGRAILATANAEASKSAPSVEQTQVPGASPQESKDFPP